MTLRHKITLILVIKLVAILAIRKVFKDNKHPATPAAFEAPLLGRQASPLGNP